MDRLLRRLARNAAGLLAMTPNTVLLRASFAKQSIPRRMGCPDSVPLAEIPHHNGIQTAEPLLAMTLRVLR
jgi:hypothetical protein